MEEMNGVIVENQISFSDFDAELELNSLKTRLDETEWNSQKDVKPTIFRVPNTIREVDPDAYEPVVIALGPYNHAKSSLEKMEGVKWKCLKAFLERNREKGLKDYMMEVRGLEHKARSAYSQELEMESDEFVEMMLLDCCFVLELLRFSFLGDDHERRNHKLMEYIENNREVWTIHHALSDMLLAENQLPFFLLQSLCRLNDPSFDLCNIAVKLMRSCCSFLLYNFNRERCLEIVKSQQELHHFLHLMYILLTYDIQKKLDDVLPAKTSSPPNKMQSLSDCSIGSYMHSKCSIGSCFISVKKDKITSTFSLFRKEPSYFETDMNITVPKATKLKEAGVKFKRNKNPTSILEVTFHNGIMRIPQLQVFDDTNYLLRNLITFEQFFDGEKNHVGNYVDFMDSLLDTAEDVAELQEDGIIINGVGSNKNIARLFNQMCKKVYLGRNGSYLRPVCLDVLKYANKWRAKLNHDYFGNPWSFISFIAALMLLIFAMIQAFFSIASYVKHS